MSRERSPETKSKEKRKKSSQHRRAPSYPAKKPPVSSGKRVWAVVGAIFLLGCVFAAWRVIRRERTSPPGAKSRRVSGGMFTDVTKEAGITFRHMTGQDANQMLYPEIMGGGVILLDYDNDGDLDIYFLNGNYMRGKKPDAKLTNVLYRNDGPDADGGWHFTDVTQEAGVADSTYAQGAEAADFDNDGDQDLYVTNLGPNVYFRNEGNGVFTRTSILADPIWGQCCSAVDYDNDGDLDIYLVNYLIYDADKQPLGIELVAGRTIREYQGPLAYPGSQDLLYRNNGDGTFTDVTKEVGLNAPGGKGMGLAVADFDNNGYPDVFVANDFQVNYLFVNEGGRFVERGVMTGVAVNADGNMESSMGVDVADVDNDGLLDIMVPCRHRNIHTLYHNEWPVFSDASARCGFDEATLGYTGFSPSFLDYDNDGDSDLFISTGRVVTLEEAAKKGLTGVEHFEDRYATVDLLLENDGQGYFRRVSPQKAGPHFRRRTVARGTAVGDLDNDGDIDLVVNVSEGRPVLLRNDTKGGHWLTLRLIGTKSNRDAIGARVIARAGGKVQHHYLKGGGSYLSVSDRRVHLGLGKATTVDSIEIIWPSGTKQQLQNVAADQFLTIRESRILLSCRKDS